jgi:hypothetical protein
LGTVRKPIFEVFYRQGRVRERWRMYRVSDATQFTLRIRLFGDNFAKLKKEPPLKAVHVSALQRLSKF